ncbi:MAG: hypothetical protein LBN96_01160 [Desulfovibrio sp.]|nr:hypothetical protein [Desulfovibrio sp.]
METVFRAVVKYNIIINSIREIINNFQKKASAPIFSLCLAPKINPRLGFKAKGEWIVSFDYGQNGSFTGGNGRTGYNACTTPPRARQGGVVFFSMIFSCDYPFDELC